MRVVIPSLLLCLIPSVTLAVPDVILESRCAAGSEYAESGTWADATAKTTAVGVSCVAGSRGTQEVGAYAEFSPTIVDPAVYDVYVSWGAFNNGGATNKGPNAEGVSVSITDLDGTSNVVVNQRGHNGCSGKNNDAWVFVASANLGAGNAGKIRVTNAGTGQCNNGASKRWVNADSVKLVFVMSTPVVPTTWSLIKSRYGS